VNVRGAGLLFLAVAVGAAGCSHERPAPPAPNRSAAKALTPTPLAYRIARIVEPKVEKLCGLAVGEQGRIYLAGRPGVVIFDAAWNRQGELPTPQPAAAVALGENGKVFVAERQRVHVFERDGRETAGWGTPGAGSGQLSYVTALAVAGTDVWVADAGNRVVHRFASTGDFIDDFGGRDPATGAPGIVCPSPYLGCAVAADGTLWVGNPGKWRVEHYDLNGRMVEAWGRNGLSAETFAGCCNPVTLAVTPEGNFITAEKGLARVKLLDRTGKLLAVLPRDEFSMQSSGMTAAADQAGRILVADPASDKVVIFELERKL
jgi:DNA-binding beta-propeller fold protein YncE